jgi:hypothetical protein
MTARDYYEEEAWDRVWKKIDKKTEKRAKNLKQFKKICGA